MTCLSCVLCYLVMSYSPPHWGHEMSLGTLLSHSFNWDRRTSHPHDWLCHQVSGLTDGSAHLYCMQPWQEGMNSRNSTLENPFKRVVYSVTPLRCVLCVLVCCICLPWLHLALERFAARCGNLIHITVLLLQRRIAQPGLVWPCVIAAREIVCEFVTVVALLPLTIVINPKQCSHKCVILHFSLNYWVRGPLLVPVRRE